MWENQSQLSKISLSYIKPDKRLHRIKVISFLIKPLNLKKKTFFTSPSLPLVLLAIYNIKRWQNLAHFEGKDTIFLSTF